MNILSFDIGGTNIKSGIINEKGEIKNFKEHDSQAKKGGTIIIDRILYIAKKYKDFDCIAISTAGQVNTKDGYIVFVNDNFPDYTGTRLKDELEKEFKLEVRIENDVNSAALGETTFGSGKNFDNVLVLTYGTGIGGGIIVDSKLFKGYQELAGEFGHIITHPNGIKCKCGGTGCYENYASTRALVNSAKKINEKYINGRVIFDALENGDKDLEIIFKNWIDEISYGLITLIHIFNPEAILLGGGIMEQTYLVSLINKKVKDNLIYSYRNISIKGTSLGNKAGILGAAALYL